VPLASATTSTSTPSTAAPTSTAAGTAQSIESSRVTTTSNNDFWTEISDSITSIIGAEAGRSVVVNPTAGVILVRALPAGVKSGMTPVSSLMGEILLVGLRSEDGSVPPVALRTLADWTIRRYPGSRRIGSSEISSRMGA
jgi:hypothetical protein